MFGTCTEVDEDVDDDTGVVAVFRAFRAACDAVFKSGRVPSPPHAVATMASRAEFLSDPTHRIRIVYTPKHCSWLNQIENWFRILGRRVIKRGSFTSESDLREKILAFSDYFNRTLAKPFKWTYTGRPLKV